MNVSSGDMRQAGAVGSFDLPDILAGTLTGTGGPRPSAQPRAGRRSALTLSLFTNFNDAETVWRDFEADALGTAFQSFDWLSAWHRNAGVEENVAPAILLVSLGRRPLMLLPFGIEMRLGARCLVWLGGKFADSKAPLLAADFAERFPARRMGAFWPSILRALPRHDVVMLENQPESFGDIPNPFITLGGVPASDAGYSLALPSAYEDFCKRFRAETRRNDRSKERKLAGKGDLVFRIAETPAEAYAMAWEILDRKAAQLRAHGVASIFEDTDYRAAFLDLASLPESRKVMQIAMLTLDGEFLSGSIAHIWRNRATLIVHAYDGSKHRKQSPGRLHLLRLIRASIEAGHAEYDLSIGHAPYKDSFCDTTMPHYNYVAAATPWGVPAAAAFRTSLSLKRAVKGNDRLMGMLRHAREWLRGA